MSLEITVRQSGHVTILDLRGKVLLGPPNDEFNGKLLEVIENKGPHILLNLANTTQIDSSGLGTVVRTFVTLERRGGSLKLLRPSGAVRIVLEALKLRTAIPTFEDEALALASFH